MSNKKILEMIPEALRGELIEEVRVLLKEKEDKNAEQPLTDEEKEMVRKVVDSNYIK